MKFKENLPITIARVGEWKGHAKGSENITPECLKSIKEHFERRGIEVPIDYEHESLENSKAPAIGWINALEIKGDELIAQPRWSEEARELIKNGAYRYVSPVFIFNAKDEQSGEELPAVLHSVALTNTPFMAQLGEIRANNQKPTKGETMKRANSEETAAQSTELNELDALKAENEALKAENAELKERINELEAQLGENKKQAAKEAVKNSLDAGLISAEQLEWANSYASKDLEGFKEFLKHAKKPEIFANNLYAQRAQTAPAINELIARKHK